MTKTLALCLLIFIFTIYSEAQTTTTTTAASSVDYFTSRLPSPGCPPGVARVRRAWNTLSEFDQQLYVKTVLQMKALKMALKSGSSTLSSVYNLFVQTHFEAWNSYAWHGTSIFLPVHKWYLQNYESALIYTAYTYCTTLGITKAQACAMSLPYWDWENDYDADDDGMCPAPGVTYGSKLLEKNDFGSQAGTDENDTVTDGAFSNTSKWILWYPVGGSNRLHREFNCGEFPLMTSGAQIMYQIISNPDFLSYASWLEGLPHGWPHMNFGWTMSMMNSPDDPAFMLHHCNIDRMYAVWQDCWDYELVPKGQMTSDHYSPSWAPYNPYTDKVYALGIDSPMPYAFSASGSGSTARATYSVVFPATWPTPRDMWPSVNGYKGLNVRYGPDTMVTAYGDSCTQNTNGWALVNIPDGYTKRDVNGGDLDLSPRFKEHQERLERETKAGRSHHEVIKDMAMEDCVAGPKIKITPKLLGWIRMNNLHIKQFDTICDKVSERADQGISGESADNKADLSQTGQSVPLWVILTASIGSIILLIAIVTLIIIYWRKKNEVDNGTPYTEMK